MLPSDPYAGEREAMVRRQIAGRGIIDPRVLDALRTVPRHAFVPPEKACRAYEDHPLEIDPRQTVSQPCMGAETTEFPELTPPSLLRSRAPGFAASGHALWSSTRTYLPGGRSYRSS